MWSDVELREIRVFLNLAEELHFGRTAERLQITPSYASQLIRRLETRLGGRLFDRTSRRVRLTPLGKQLLVELEPAHRQLENALKDTRDVAAGITGTVRIGTYLRLLLGPQIPEIIDTFEARHPGCHAAFVDTGLERDYLDWLRAGDVDIVVCWLPVSPPEFTVGPIVFRDNRVLMVARGHPLAELASVTVEDLADYKVSDVPAFNREMMDSFIPPATPSGKALRRVPRRTLDETLMAVVLGEQVHPTISSSTIYYTDPRITVIPFADLAPCEAVLVWRTSDRTPRVKAFTRTAADVLADHQPQPVNPVVPAR
jgi:DNA-binding transcriptional LysR family regulator